jgi:hypothetical protein
VTKDEDGNVVLIANGLYAGEKCTGSNIKSVNTFAPGSFEVTMRIPSQDGICIALWLYNNFTTDDEIDHNYEIDMEMHGTAVKDGALRNDGNLSTVLCSTWLTESEDDHTYQYAPVGYNLNDGEFHTFRMDWHTGDDARVEYYVDGNLLCTITENVPDNEMYFNIGLWFPKGWCGEPTFEQDFAVVSSFTYTPFEDETAETANCDTLSGAGNCLSNIPVPTENLLANGSFSADSYMYVWEGNAQQTANGAYVAEGNTLQQTVTVDCGGIDYQLTVDHDGDVTVVVEYGSLTGGETTSETLTLSDGVYHFTPAEGSTKFTVKITAGNGGATLHSAVVTIG